MTRPCKLTKPQEAKIRQYVDTQRKLAAGVTAQMIKGRFNLDVSLRTIQRLLHKFGLKSRYRRRSADGGNTDTMARFAWAKKMKNMNWNRVLLWLDAKYFKMPMGEHTPLRSVKVWRKVGEAYKKWAVRGTAGMKAPGVHVLAGFGPGKNKDGRMIFTTTYKKMNGENATAMLTRTIMPALKRHYGKKRSYLVMMDGEPSFRGGQFESALKKYKVKKLDFCPRSGDKAPMENVWSKKTKEVNAKVMASKKWRNGVKDTVANKAEWSRFVQKIVKKSDKPHLRKLIDTMGDRVTSLIKNRGGPIRW